MGRSFTQRTPGSLAVWQHLFPSFTSSISLKLKFFFPPPLTTGNIFIFILIFFWKAAYLFVDVSAYKSLRYYCLWGYFTFNDRSARFFNRAASAATVTQGNSPKFSFRGGFYVFLNYDGIRRPRFILGQRLNLTGITAPKSIVTFDFVITRN